MIACSSQSQVDLFYGFSLALHEAKEERVWGKNDWEAKRKNV